MAWSDFPSVLKPLMKSSMSTERFVVSISTRAKNFSLGESVNCESSMRFPA